MIRASVSPIEFFFCHRPPPSISTRAFGDQATRSAASGNLTQPFLPTDNGPRDRWNRSPGPTDTSLPDFPAPRGFTISLAGRLLRRLRLLAWPGERAGTRRGAENPLLRRARGGRRSHRRDPHRKPELLRPRGPERERRPVPCSQLASHSDARLDHQASIAFQIRRARLGP